MHKNDILILTYQFLQGRYFPGMFGPMGLFPQPWLDPAFFYNEYLVSYIGLVLKLFGGKMLF